MAPVPDQLSAKFHGSFSYFTVKDRLPVILTQVLDHLCREKTSISQTYGSESIEELKQIVGQLSQLKNELQTNKSIKEFLSNSNSSLAYDDNELYNRHILEYRAQYGEDPSWFTASWLFVECYFYKKIHNIFEQSHHFKNYDPFFHLKTKAFTNSKENVTLLSDFIFNEVISTSNLSPDKKKTYVLQMVEMSLWGNQCDLSISGGQEIILKSTLHKLVEIRENLLVSHLEEFWEYLIKLPQDKKEIAIILDNAGMEIVADLCLAIILTEFNLVSSIVFYPKTRPWFVSDVLETDLNFMLRNWREEKENVAKLGETVSKYFEKGIWRLKKNSFWTGPHDFSNMKKVDPQLYNELSQYAILIFKGDLNYRKLVGDRDWPTDTPLKKSFRGFLPSSLLVLRTIKGGPVVGLNETSPKTVRAKAKGNWNISGDFGVIQFQVKEEGL